MPLSLPLSQKKKKENKKIKETNLFREWQLVQSFSPNNEKCVGWATAKTTPIHPHTQTHTHTNTQLNTHIGHVKNDAIITGHTNAWRGKMKRIGHCIIISIVSEGGNTNTNANTDAYIRNHTHTHIHIETPTYIAYTYNPNSYRIYRRHAATSKR